MKFKFMWIKNLNTKTDTLNPIEEKVEDSHECIGTGDNCLNRAALAKATRSTVDKWISAKLKSFCLAKDTAKRGKWHPTEWEKMFYQHHIR